MGIFDFLSPPKTVNTSYVGNSQSNQTKGLEAMQQWHNYTIMKYPENYSLTFQELQTKTRALSGFVAEGIGMTIDINNMTDGQVQTAMQNLSDAGKGAIPSGVSDWINSMINVSVNPSFMDTVAGAAVLTGQDIVADTKAVGDTIITTASSLKTLLPIMIVAAVGLIIYDKAKAV